MSNENQVEKIKSQIIILEDPVSFNNVEYKEIRLTRPKVRHIEKFSLDNPTSKDMVKLISDITGVPQLAIEEFSVVDFTVTSEALLTLLPQSKKEEESE